MGIIRPIELFPTQFSGTIIIFCCPCDAVSLKTYSVDRFIHCFHHRIPSNSFHPAAICAVLFVRFRILRTRVQIVPLFIRFFRNDSKETNYLIEDIPFLLCIEPFPFWKQLPAIVVSLPNRRGFLGGCFHFGKNHFQSAQQFLQFL